MIFLLLLTNLAYGQDCISNTFCSTGEALKYIQCGRGQDCSKAKDLGLHFQSDCKVSRWLGDAQETRSYKVRGEVVSILPPAWTPDVPQENFKLSADKKKLTSIENSKHVFATDACKK